MLSLVFAAVLATCLVVLGGLVSASGEAAPTQGTVKIGLVSDVGRFNDRSFNQSALEGLKRARSKLGVQGREVESRAASDYIPNLSTLARQDYNPTIAVGFLMADAVNDVARQFPNNQFAIIDYSVKAPPFTDASKNVKTPTNVRGLIFSTNENSYMVGCLSGLMVKAKGGKQVISAVGGIKLPTVDIFIAGYRAGAKRCNKKISVLIGYSQDFVAQDKCKEVALDQIAKGSQVIFQVAGGCGLGALGAAKDKKRWGIGVDRDQAFLGKHILTSAVKRVDQSVYLTALSAKNNAFKGGVDAVFTLKNAGVGIGKINAKVPKAFIKQMNALRPLIISGKIKPPKTLG